MHLLPLPAALLPVSSVPQAFLGNDSISLSILRTDLVDREISGNKYFKLRHNLVEAAAGGHSRLLSFGGPWSNHLHALAAAGRRFGFETVGVVRGDLPEPLNPCLEDALSNGMRLHPLSRSDYSRRMDPAFVQGLHEKWGSFFLIPEGGANRAGLEGCGEIMRCFDESAFDVICVACGTGTTLAGLALCSQTPLVGFQVLKGAGYMEREVTRLLAGFPRRQACQWEVQESYHMGGYARVNVPLMSFITEFESASAIPLEPVYTGKMIFGIVDMIKRDFFPQNSRILAIHGGGLQGNRGLR